MSTPERNPSSITPASSSGSGPAREPVARGESIADYPILTEVVDDPAAPDATPRNIGLEELERELRVELVGQMQADLERRIEARVYYDLGTSIEEIAGRIRTELVTEVRRAVREIVAEVLAEEKTRAQPDTTTQADIAAPER